MRKKIGPMNNPFFTNKDFDTQHGDGPEHKSNLITPDLAVEVANSKVVPLVERIESQQKIILQSRRELDATFKANDGLREENARLKAEARVWHRLVPEENLIACESLNATYREALEFYADGFKIMDHIDGTYTIHETWYAKARKALIEGKNEQD